MVTDAIARALLAIFGAFLSILPEGHLLLPDLGEVGTWLARVNLLLPAWTFVGPLLGAILVALPVFVIVRLAFFIYHQFWGSS